MPSTASVVDWLDRYVDVWKSGNQARVAELFTDDAVYYTDPFHDPRIGLGEIEEYWRISGDAPEAFEARYSPLAIAAELAVVAGFSRYLDDSRRVEKDYENLFVLRFAEDGRCCEYREWYMLRGEEAGAS